MKRGTPLKRTPIKRTRSMSSGTPKPSRNPPTKSKKRKRKTKYAMRERDFDYMGWVKLQHCLLAGTADAGPCTGVVEADHAGDRGMGHKAPDDTCIPLCSGHHLDRHACTGFFRKREDETYAELKHRKRAWRHAEIAKTQADYQQCGGGVIDAVF